MKATLFNEHGGLRTFVLVLAPGDEAITAVSSFAPENGLLARIHDRERTAARASRDALYSPVPALFGAGGS